MLDPEGKALQFIIKISLAQFPIVHSCALYSRILMIGVRIIAHKQIKARFAMFSTFQIYRSHVLV